MPNLVILTLLIYSISLFTVSEHFDHPSFFTLYKFMIW